MRHERVKHGNNRFQPCFDDRRPYFELRLILNPGAESVEKFHDGCNRRIEVKSRFDVFRDLLNGPMNQPVQIPKIAREVVLRKI